MKQLKWMVVCLALATVFGAPLTAFACPLCSEAIANSNDASSAEDADNFPQAMNQSIYLMLAVPYTALGVVGFFIYRGVKQNEAYRQALEASRPETPADPDATA